MGKISEEGQERGGEDENHRDKRLKLDHSPSGSAVIPTAPAQLFSPVPNVELHSSVTVTPIASDAWDAAELDAALSPALADLFATLSPGALDYLPSSDPVNDAAPSSSYLWRTSVFPASPLAEDSDDRYIITDDDLVDDLDLVQPDEVVVSIEEEEATISIGEEEGILEDDAHMDGAGVIELTSSFATSVNGKEKQAASHEDEDVDDSDYYDLYPDPDPFAKLWNPADPPAFVTGVGKRLAISSEALEKARALLNDEAQLGSSPSTQPSILLPLMRPSTSPGSNLRSSHPAPSSAAEPPRPAARAARPQPPLFSTGFTSGSGCPIAGPSSAALARATALISSQSSSPAPKSPQRPRQTSGLTSGSGQAVAGPSDASSEAATALISHSSPCTSPTKPASSSRQADKEPSSSLWAPPTSSPPLGETGSRALDAVMDVFSGPSSTSTTTMLRVPPALRSRRDNASSGSPSPEKATFLDSRVPLVTKSSNRPSTLGCPPADPKPQDPVVRLKSPPKRLKPAPVTTTASPFRLPIFRSPLISRAPLASSSASAVSGPTVDPGTRATGTPLKTAPALRRLNVSMTPRPRTSPGHKFSTPFKNGVRPAGLKPSGLPSGSQHLVGPTKVAVAINESAVAVKDTAATAGLKINSLMPVFDLTPAGPRTSLKDGGFHPLARFFEDLQQAGIPVEVLAMDAASAQSFTFDCGRGETDALAALEQAGGTLASLRWVKNHWALIVWKLASLVRSKPELLTTYWCWETAVAQLKYRYEREVNNAQRSAIKRIQEQDSSPALPMILCVTQLRWDEADIEAPERPLVIVGLELTDGWYRIRANVDATLKSACERGKIAVGSKLVLTGSRLDSSRDGTDVLDALSCSSLVISGNSTALAPWHAKLGFVNKAYFTSLDSITPGGGLVPLLQVAVERVYPCGYLDMKKPKDGTWNEEEERERADQWEKGRAKAEARMADAQDGIRGEWDDIYDLLDEAAKAGCPDPSKDQAKLLTEEEPDEILDRLEEAESKSSVVRKLSRRQLDGCLKLAREYVEQARQQALVELQDEVATSFPPRDVRSFRVLRIKDSQGSSSRTAQLTVWDAAQQGCDFFQVDKVYLVTNIVPKGTWKRRSLEISLATRRDTKWQRLE